jgi:serine/threonine protein kinase
MSGKLYRFGLLGLTDLARARRQEEERRNGYAGGRWTEPISGSAGPTSSYRGRVPGPALAAGALRLPLHRLTPARYHNSLLSHMNPPTQFETESTVEQFQGTERFLIQSRLGAGGMGVVYRAFDRQRQTDVALKTLAQVDADSVHRFKREFRSLARITHPNLVVLYEFCFGGDRWFYTMELVEGLDFLTYARGGEESAAAEAQAQTLLRPTVREGQSVMSDAPLVPASFDEGRLRSTLLQMARGVHALHESGTLHGDLKPANVLVTPNGRTVILDFGLARSLAPDDLYDTIELDTTYGTPAYMSPEQVAGQPTGEGSDWYSVGVMLYEALTGQLPFQGTTLEILARKSVAAPQPPRQIAWSVPSDLDALCAALLSRSPRDRPSGVDVLRRLGGAPSDVEAELTSTRPPPSTPVFVGRQLELQVLREAFQAVRAGRPVWVQVHGISGIGKTALVRHFLTTLHERNEGVVLPGRCYECESVPYKMFDGLIDALVRYLKQLTRAEVESLMPRDVQLLARIFPALLRVEAVMEAPRRDIGADDLHALRRRAFAALKELFGRMADRRSLVLFIDDLQWGDQDSSRLLADVLGPPDPPAVLLVASYRSEEVATNPVLQGVLQSAQNLGTQTEVREIAVSALSESDSREVAFDLLGSRDAETRAQVETITREAQGSPFFVWQLVEYIKAGLSQRAAQLDEMLGHRVSLLPEDARRLLEVIAVAGQPVPQELAAQAAGLQGNPEKALSLLRSCNLVRTGGMQPLDPVETYHDRIRETAARRLAPEQLRRVHESLAVSLEMTNRPDPEALMVHWQGANKPDRAAKYAAVAAARAAEALAFDRAADLFRFSLQRLGADDPSRRDLQTQLGDALANAGRAPEAARAYLDAAVGAPLPEGLELERRAAEQLLTSGHSSDGRRVAGSVLKAVGFTLPTTPQRAVLSLLLQRAKIRLRGVRFRERDKSGIPEDILRRIDICWSMGIGLSMVDTTVGAIFTARYLLLSLAGGEPCRTARALAFEGIHRASIRVRSTEATRLIETARTLAQRLGDPHVEGFTLLMGGVSSYFRGNWRVALETCDRAGAIFCDSCKGATWELATTNTYATYSLFYLGEWAELSRRVLLLLDAACRRNNEYAASLLRVPFGMVAWLLRGDVEGARREADAAIRRYSPSTFQLQHALHFLAMLQIDHYVGDGCAAWNRVRETWPALRRSLLLKLESVRVFALQMRASSGVLHASSGSSIPRVVMRDAARLCRMKVTGARPVGQLIQAAVHAKRGRTESAAALMWTAATGFDDADMTIHAAATRHRLGELLGGEEGQQMIDAACAVMTRQGIREPARVTAMLVPR